MIKEELIKYLSIMIRIRFFEEKAMEFYSTGKLTGMCHPYIGEEAVAVGVCSCLNKDDYIVSTHRGHGHAIAKGMDPKRMMAELCAKEQGYCKGRGGSMHIADISLGHLGANGIVGAGLPIAVGAGLSIKYRETMQVCVCFFGDAASNIGTFHESINMAAAFKLPIIFVCENNLYGLSTPISYSGATPNIADRAKGYNIPGELVDGMNVLAVREVTEEAIKNARDRKGPTLIECKTYRYLGHSKSDNRPYRTKNEEEEWKKKDPILGLKNMILENKIATIEEILKIENRIKKEIEEAGEYAINLPEPDTATVEENVYA